MYSIKGKYIVSDEIKGFLLIDRDTGTEVNKQHNEVIKMIHEGQIENFRIVELDGNTYIINELGAFDNIETLHLQDKYTIKEELIQDGNIIGFIIKNNKTQEENNISCLKAWLMIYEELISNAEAKCLLNEESGKIEKVIIWNKELNFAG